MDDRITPVTMPKWGLSMKTGRITDWLAAPGDEVAEGDGLAEIDTDKIAGTLEAPAGGVLRAIVAEAGGDAPVGCAVALLAPGDVPQEEIAAAVAEARELLARGQPAEPDGTGPATGAVDVAGRSLAYATEGDGPETVVLVHGFGGDKDSWLFVRTPLAARHTVYALDLPGHGDSVKDVGDGGLVVLADAVTGFLDVLGLDRVHLVGHSLGGAVAGAVAGQVPGRVRSLTLVAPAGYGPELDSGYLRGFAGARTRRELKPHLAKLFADGDRVTRQLVDDLLRYKRLDGVAEALAALVPTVEALDLARTPLDVPLRVVWGGADRVIPASNRRSLEGRAREVRVVEGAGHMVHMEAPGEVTQLIERAVTG
ncbi:acetoin dehydrogenase dihydrolipoyllysine-residue acetyltransferase subunit [Streptomyces longispororuber]|uniref:acetoin dehydrogenase dihydrolipoyllysine-residue acetyltransferase subunit n=1 Tax=Streptomyces longispororuber TaxID=68230 RepID=UPI00210BDCEF|nr:acetoin dehydrogenase dihydrolipoyllysine-residue acetyltransferase subunit [Streptomyces longispororuber]MCQ4212294.1 acetoin dehydrogenase dihydrolipoyllysine-residue acetyltransferase subunit [Streptomyces longispororuber]